MSLGNVCLATDLTVYWGKAHIMKTENVELFTSVEAADEAVKTAMAGVVSALVTATGVVRKAVLTYRHAGLDDKKIGDRVRGLLLKSVNRRTINHALLQAGIRSRAVRCDVKYSRDGLLSVGLVEPKAEKAEKPEPTEPADEGGEGDEGGTDEPVNPAVELARHALRLCGGDMEKAAVALKAALGNLA